jgi:hypothetical protein
MEVVLVAKVKVVPRAGVEPARPFGQRILSPFTGSLPRSARHYYVVFTDVSAVKATLKQA